MYKVLIHQDRINNGIFSPNIPNTNVLDIGNVIPFCQLFYLFIVVLCLSLSLLFLFKQMGKYYGIIFLYCEYVTLRLV